MSHQTSTTDVLPSAVSGMVMTCLCEPPENFQGIPSMTVPSQVDTYDPLLRASRVQKIKRKARLCRYMRMTISPSFLSLPVLRGRMSDTYLPHYTIARAREPSSVSKTPYDLVLSPWGLTKSARPVALAMEGGKNTCIPS